MKRERRWELNEHDLPVRFARGEAARFLTEHGADQDQEAALLVVSELVTNAFRHGAPPVVMTMSLLDTGLRMDVEDGSPRMPVQRSGGECGGFGLTVAGELASLSFHPLPAGKLVRAFLPTRTPAQQVEALAEEIVRLVLDDCVASHDSEAAQSAVVRLLRDLESDLQPVRSGR